MAVLAVIAPLEAVDDDMMAVYRKYLAKSLDGPVGTGDYHILRVCEAAKQEAPLNSFQRGIRNVSYMMIVFMLDRVPIVSPGS